MIKVYRVQLTAKDSLPWAVVDGLAETKEEAARLALALYPDWGMEVENVSCLSEKLSFGLPMA